MRDNINLACREMTFEEEAQAYENEARRLLENEIVGTEPPFANSIVRRGRRIIDKARREIKDEKARAEKFIFNLQRENEELKKQLKKYETIKSVANMVLGGKD